MLGTAKKDFPARTYQLKIAIDPVAKTLGSAVLEPADVAFEDILALSQPQKLAFLVRHPILDSN